MTAPSSRLYRSPSRPPPPLFSPTFTLRVLLSEFYFLESLPARSCPRASLVFFRVAVVAFGRFHINVAFHQVCAVIVFPSHYHRSCCAAADRLSTDRPDHEAVSVAGRGQCSAHQVTGSTVRSCAAVSADRGVTASPRIFRSGPDRSRNRWIWSATVWPDCSVNPVHAC